MGLTLSASLPDRGFEVAVEVGDGEHLAVLGPNGAGKSTLLGLVAGTVRASQGSAALAGRPLFDTAAGRWLPPHARGVALLRRPPVICGTLRARHL